MEIKSLTNIDFGTIFKAFSKAFADYDIQLNEYELMTMWKRRGFNPDLSFAAFNGKEIAAFTLMVLEISMEEKWLTIQEQEH
jgi:hypothetical protein